MKPTSLRPGDRVVNTTVKPPFRITWTFVRRTPDRRRHGQGPAENIFVSADCVGLSGPDDKGLCTISDYDLSRKFESVEP